MRKPNVRVTQVPHYVVEKRKRRPIKIHQEVSPINMEAIRAMTAEADEATTKQWIALAQVTCQAFLEAEWATGAMHPAVMETYRKMYIEWRARAVNQIIEAAATQGVTITLDQITETGEDGICWFDMIGLPDPDELEEAWREDARGGRLYPDWVPVGTNQESGVNPHHCRLPPGHQGPHESRAFGVLLWEDAIRSRAPDSHPIPSE
mgnify:CR=1 FL=1